MLFHVVRGVASSQGLRWRRAWLGAGLLVVLIPSLLLAQEPPATEPAPADQVEPSEQAVAVFSATVEVGSRGAERTRIDTPVPVDMLPIQELADDSGQFDIGQLLQYVAPSFNSNRQSGSDGSDHIDSATLRGLGPDQVLVLINGKRRHSSSLVYIFGSRSRGNVGTDLNTIPINAIDRIEILRDGAAAQYGSDAIAGVINIILRSEPGLDVALGAGGYTAGDGDYGQAAFNYGLGLGEKGMLNITGEYLTRDKTDRSSPEEPRAIGDAATDNTNLFYNLSLPFGEKSEFYADGGYNERDGLAGAWYRGGIGSDDIPSRNSAEMYPDGFVPDIGTDIEDLSTTVGVRTFLGEWIMDLSTTYGSNQMEYLISNTLNASYATQNDGLSPTSFAAGGFEFTQSTTNLDFTRYYNGVMSGFSLAGGLEYRRESYLIFDGEEGSWYDYDGPGGGNAGSQGFPGFQPVDETDKSRDAMALYLDAELKPSERFLVAAAVRGEDYSDFGSTVNGKLALGYRLASDFNLRGSASTGFRAPSLHQRYFSSTFTDFIAGEAADVKLAPNDSELALLVGIPSLIEETSSNISLGFAWQPKPNIETTLDAYVVDIDDRIILTGGFTADDPDIGHIIAELGLAEARFFTNAIDTRTTGVDLTFSHGTRVGTGLLNTVVALNYNENEVRNVNTAPGLEGKEDVYFSQRERMFVIGAAPDFKGTISGNYSLERWSFGGRLGYFGVVELGTWSQLDDPSSPNQHYDPVVVLDLSVGFRITKGLEWTVGGSNIFDEMPTEQDPNETENGGRWENVQMGFNGAAIYTRLVYRLSTR
jgi:iron complex outermembrane receptor protein